MPFSVFLLPPPDRRSRTNQTTPSAAVERVPEIKPEDVEEVFYGNVLSAK
jgi:acetyl-CoA acetyltransferase